MGRLRPGNPWNYVGNPALTIIQGVIMDDRGSMKAGTALAPVARAATPNLIYHVDAISRALKNWNDIEALKLLRLHWREIANAVRELDSQKGASITVPLREVPLQPDQRTSPARVNGADAGDASAHDDELTAEQRPFGSNVRAFSRV
jgi:hypothetical protein